MQNPAPTNALTISFADWLQKMAEAELPLQARVIAIYAAVFDLEGADTIALISGTDTAGRADKTFKKWKEKLVADGWLLVDATGGGRGIGMRLQPAVAETPVLFTGVTERKRWKYYPRNSSQRGVEVADTGVKNTPVFSTETVKNTPVLRASRARIDSTSLHLTTDSTNKYTLPRQPESHQAPRAHAGWQEEIPGLNGATSTIVSDLAKWLSPYVPDFDGARKTVSEMVALYGDRAVRDGFADMKARIADGEMRVPTVRQLYGFIKQSKTTASTGPPRRPAGEVFQNVLKQMDEEDGHGRGK
jgi:hypothetical protein